MPTPTPQFEQKKDEYAAAQPIATEREPWEQEAGYTSEFETQPEIPASPEDDFLEADISRLATGLKQNQSAQPKKIPQVRDEMLVKIEHIMEEGLVDAFKEMTPVQKQEFKMGGEKAAAQIRALLGDTKIKVKKIFDILVAWLKLIPGVNRFFIEQEAKIKADKITSLASHHHER